MNWYERAKRLNEADFKELIGVKKHIFAVMVEILEKDREQKNKLGRKSKLTIEEQLMLTLKYMRHYVTQHMLAFEFDIGEATVHDIIVNVENVLIKSGKFSLPGKKTLVKDETLSEEEQVKEDNQQIVLIDATESPIERPKKNITLEKRNVIL